MEPNKFEKHIAEQMKERQIQPSTDAWERISEQIENSTAVKKNNFMWYAIAASFIGILMISILFFQSGDQLLDDDVQMVDFNKKEAPVKQNLETLNEKRIEEVPNLEDNEPLNATNEFEISKNDLVKETLNLQSADDSSIVLNDDTVEKIDIEEFMEVNDNSIELKIQEVLAQVDSIELNNTALTNAEVDELLRNAQEEILRDKLFKQNGSVDAIALLSEVEDELDQSFRDQIFESLKEGFLIVRTAVAERNN